MTIADINFQNEYGETKLHTSAAKGNLAECRQLLHQGANPNLKDCDGCTVLHYSAMGPSVNVVAVTSLLITATGGADLDTQNNEGKTALWIAVNRKHVDLVKELLAAGANVNIPDSAGNTPLIIAFLHGYDAPLLNYDGSSTAQLLNIIVTMLLEAGANTNMRNENGKTAIMWAIDSPEKILMLVQAGADIKIRDAYGFSVLMIAALRHIQGGIVTTEVLWILKALGADLDLDLVSFAGSEFQNLQHHLPFPLRDTTLLDLMIELGADINGTDMDGRTALMRATTKERTQTLLAAGSDVDANDKEGKTALMMAASNEQAKMLIEAGADIDIVDKYGNTALVYAGQRGLWEAAYLMMKLSKEHSDQDYVKFLQSSSHFMSDQM